VLGELVQTIAGKWITYPPTRCPNGPSLARIRSSLDVSSVLDTAAVGTRAGIAEPAMP
jgi:hypothetical protein